MKQLLCIIGVLALVALGWLGGSYFPFGFADENGKTPQRDTIYIKDTNNVKPKIIEVIPEGYDIVPIGYTDSVQQQIISLEDSLERKPKIVTKDSLVYIEIPMEQKHYGDSTYDAWVSGYKPSLDSLKMYSTKEIITIREKRKPWSIGPQAGIGIGTGGITPYVGIGITYSIWEF